jgi:ribosomal silencing factor RsfS
MAEAATSTKKKRGRPPKNPTVEVNQKITEEVTPVTNEFNSFRSSAVGLSSYYFGMNIFDFYSPEQLVALVRNPMDSNKQLRELSLTLYGCNGIYTNTVDYTTAMPTLDKVVIATGKSDQKNRKNKEKMESTLRTIKHKEIVRDALFKGMIEGIAFYYFETTSRPRSRSKMMSNYDVERITEINELGINASVISLPADYTKIVGIKNSSYVIAFDLSYFDTCIDEDRDKKLKKYPKEIRDAYNAGNHNNWVVLDNTKTIVHKVRSKRDEPWGRPLVLAAINDILYNDYFTDTKRNVLDEVNNRIIYQTFPQGKEQGTSALTGEQQKHQHDTVKGAVMSKNNKGGISFFSVAAGTKIDSIDATNTDIFDDKNESNLTDKIATNLGFAASLLNGTGSGTYSSQENNLDLISSQLFMWIDQIEEELNKVINANIIADRNNRVEVKYLPITNVNKKSMVAFAKDLYLQGKGSLALWASACGISPDIYFALLDQELADDIDNKYPVHQTSYTFSGNNTGDTGGRPVDEDTQNPSTLKTRKNNTNNAPKPSKR